MSIVSASSLSAADMLLIGNNVLPRVRHESRVGAVNRALAPFNERIERLYRRTDSGSRANRHRARSAA